MRSPATTSSTCATPSTEATCARDSARCSSPMDTARTGRHSPWRSDVDILDFHAAHGDGVVLVTGATGLLGADVVKRWTTCGAPRRLAVLVRDRTRWETLARHAGLAPGAVVAIEGDIAIEGLGLAAGARAWLASRTTAMVHLAADTTFSRPLDQARRVNRDGTAHLLALAADCPHVERFAYVSTAFDDRSGAVTQRNAVHQALRLFHDGLAAMIPGLPDSVLDVVPTDYVSDAIARLALRGGIDGATVHLCAGAGAMPLGELLDECHARWAMDPVWRRRGIELPSQADLETWELFTQAVEETGHPRLRRVTRALTHFLPQLALPKCFDTRVADALLGAGPPPVREYWGHMLDHLQRTAWRGVPGLVEVAA